MRLERTWIPMPDGVRLAATLYFPDPLDEPVPALLEYLPYRKDDQMAERDYDLYAYVVPRGYAGARVDIRGTGGSEGVLPDREYSEQEQADGEAVIDWLSRQPWCDGGVGMWGISWGGFNAIHMGMRRPPALKAIVALMATDDLFHDDIHYIDGMFHVDEWEPMQDLLNAMSPPPGYPIDEEVLQARFERPPWKLGVVRRQRDGPYWRRGSLRFDYERLAVPAMLVGGLFDGYRDSVARMVRHLGVPVKGILGPWSHTFPHRAPAPVAIEWRDEALRWWERWLKGMDNGVEREPPLAVYIRDWHPPDPRLEDVPGRWRWLGGWPPRGLQELSLYPRPDRSLGESPQGGAVHRLRCVPSAGIEAGFWWGEIVPDQRPIDAFSLAYDSPPIEEDLVVVGMPRAVLRAEADAPLAHWFARLCDVAPDGTSSLVSGGGAHGAHRRGRDVPEPLIPGRPERLEFDLHFTTWTFRRGHRIRLALSNAMWPMVWPTPHPLTTGLHLGESCIVLPVIPGDGDGPTFGAPAARSAQRGVRVSGGPVPAPPVVRRDEGTGITTVSWSGEVRYELPFCSQTVFERMEYEVRDRDPAASSVRAENRTDVDLEDRRLRWDGSLEIRSDASYFDYSYRRRLLEGARVVRERSWEERVPRDHH